jgi:hypothetical protein
MTSLAQVAEADCFFVRCNPTSLVPVHWERSNPQNRLGGLFPRFAGYFLFMRCISLDVLAPLIAGGDGSGTYCHRSMSLLQAPAMLIMSLSRKGMATIRYIGRLLQPWQPKLEPNDTRPYGLLKRVARLLS